MQNGLRTHFRLRTSVTLKNRKYFCTQISIFHLEGSEGWLSKYPICVYEFWKYLFISSHKVIKTAMLRMVSRNERNWTLNNLQKRKIHSTQSATILEGEEVGNTKELGGRTGFLGLYTHTHIHSQTDSCTLSFIRTFKDLCQKETSICKKCVKFKLLVHMITYVRLIWNVFTQLESMKFPYFQKTWKLFKFLSSIDLQISKSRILWAKMLA